MRRFRLLVPVLALVAAVCASMAPGPSAIDRINHVVVIYQENWSFDGLFGTFPGANGLANAGDTVKQTDRDGRPYATLPPWIDNRERPPAPDPRIPAGLPVAPFNQRRQDGPVLVRALMVSRAWEDTAIIITYDENGGRWDHVPPPRVDRWGPGMRVPTIVISRFAKRRYVDHTYYDTTSIMKLIGRRWGLAALGTRDA
jgi:phospholipase C